MSEDLRAWADTLEAALVRGRIRIVSRVRVLASTASTQDAARREARPGLLVVADRQTRGRGTHGRAWTQGEGGLAVTFAVEPAPPGRLSLAAGVAACIAGEPDLPPRTLALRWPNDLVARADERKVGGVLIEITEGAAGSVACIGIGINVSQAPGSWTGELAGRAASLRELGSARSRLDVAVELLLALDRALAWSDAALIEAWRARDVLPGTRRRFLRGRDAVEGIVVGLDPALAILVRTDAGDVVRLPAETASLDRPR